MHNSVKRIGKAIFCIMILFFVTLKVSAKEAQPNGIVWVPEVKHDTSLPLTEMNFHLTKASQPIIAPMHHLPYQQSKFVSQQDSVAQVFQGNPLIIQITSNFLGLGVGFGDYSPGVTPPDTTGAPGLTQYVQIVNSSFAIFNKADGALQLGPGNTNGLWAGFGGVCETTNNGDGLVKYDQLANRWVISQFAFNTIDGQNAPPFLQCVAVSTTADARGAYYRYAFQFNNFNDYGKIGLSPAGYFLSFFMFNGGTFLGPMACALQRDQMLVGQPAGMQCFNPSPQSTMIDLIPADLDGTTLPPSKTPEFYLSLNQRTHEINLYRFYVNWNNPNLSSFQGPVRVSGTAPFGIPCSDEGPRDPDQQNQGCIPQPNTVQKLDQLADRLMYRLAYRQFPKHGTLMINHTVAGTASGAAGSVRWYQINIVNDGLYTPDLVQQGTFSPNANSRWMGSVAIDKNENIALGYSVSSMNLFPSIAITGRQKLDPLDTMRNELTLVAGGGSQTGSYRWGDYSTMAVDPVDDCTFWFTTEYLRTTGTSASWSTNVTAFRFPGCG